MNTVIHNLWRLLLIPAFMFFFAAIEQIISFTSKETIIIIMHFFLASFVCFGFYFVCDILHRKLKETDS